MSELKAIGPFNVTVRSLGQWDNYARSVADDPRAVSSILPNSKKAVW